MIVTEWAVAMHVASLAVERKSFLAALAKLQNRDDVHEEGGETCVFAIASHEPRGRQRTKGSKERI